MAAEVLRPGETRTIRVSVDYPFYAGVLKPGSYEAQVVYYAASKRLLQGATEDLATNWARFRVSD